MPGIVIVSYPEDEHGTALERELTDRKEDVFRVSLAELPKTHLTWELGTGLTVDGVEVRTANWAGIWRRPGHADLVSMDPRFVEFADSESRDAFRGALFSLGISWINDPEVLWRAEHKILQLETARRAGIRVPPTIVTNDPQVAERFARREQVVIVKAVRYGLVATEPSPLVAWTSRVTPKDKFEFAGVPVLLQREVRAAEHIRVVTVGPKAFASRLEASELDWRALPENAQRWQACIPQKLPSRLVTDALHIATALGLGYTSQDWIVDRSGDALFLEANPNGQWLFLDETYNGAITAAIADWLTARARGKG